MKKNVIFDEIIKNLHKNKITKISYDDLLELCDSIVNKYQNDIDDSFFDELLSKLEKINIKILYDDIDDAKDIDIDLNQVSDDLLVSYFKDISKYPLLTLEEEKQCFLELKNGNENIKEKIINSNLRLVVAVAKKYQGSGLSFIDLIQEGNIGLMKAIDKFEISRNIKFSTYATFWIKQSIIRSIKEKRGMVKIPESVQELIRKIKTLENEQFSKEEIAKKLNITDYRLEELLSLKDNFDTVSLEQPVGDDETSILSDFVEDEENSFLNIIEKKELREMLYKLFSVILDESEKLVLELRYGLYDGNYYTLDQTIKLYYKFTGIKLSNSEAVRKIENRALRKLRNPSNNCELRLYLDDYKNDENNKKVKK